MGFLELKMKKTMLHAFTKFKSLSWASGSTRSKLTKLILVVALVVAPLWFMPWVFTIPLGLSIYFPYGPDAQSRSISLAGPVPGALGLSDWVGSDELPESCVAAAVAAEDTRFYEHHGLDMDSIESAWASNPSRSASTDKQGKKSKRKSSKVRGASTITQQLVKNLYLSRERSYLRKAREAAGALALEVLVSKQTIMTWYLNIVEFGPDVYGLEAAARHYFKKPAQQLKPHECVSLIVILPSPNRWNASLVSKKYTPFFVRRYGVVASRMRILGHLNAATLREVRVGAPFFFAAPRPDERLGPAAGDLPDLPLDLPASPLEDGGQPESEDSEPAAGDLGAGEALEPPAPDGSEPNESPNPEVPQAEQDAAVPNEVEPEQDLWDTGEGGGEEFPVESESP